MLELFKVFPPFFLTALLLAIVPGQGVAMVLRQSIVGGKRPAFYAVLGNSSGLLIWGAASGIGLSAIFAKSPLAFNILKYAGVLYLGFLSFQTLLELKKEFGKFDFSNNVKVKFGEAFRVGLLTNLTNVKAAVFAVAFIPQFVPKSFNLGFGIFILSCVQACASLSWYSSLILAVEKAAIFLERPKVRRALTGISALGILGLAIGLLLTKPR
jgi:threonine/homoserine/homoserine lactone efflux protein